MSAVNAWQGTPPAGPTVKAQHAARNLIRDAARGGAAMATNVEQHCAGLGRQQLVTVITALFTALAEHADV